MDRVDGIVRLDDSEIDPNAEMLKHKDDDFIAGVGKDKERLIVLVNCDNVVPSQLRDAIGSPTEQVA